MPRKTDADGLYHRPDSPVWWASYTDARGRRTRRATGTRDRAEAQAILARWRTQAHAERHHGAAPERLIEDLLLGYLTGPSATKRSHATDKHRAKALLRKFSGRDLRTLSARDITAYLAWRQAEGVTASTANRDLALLSAALNWARLALEWDLPNPIEGRLLPEPEGRVRWITPEEAERLITAASHARTLHGLDDFLIIALHTGMRRGELLGLEWARVDLTAGALDLESQHTKAGKRRRIPLSSRARAALIRRAAFRAGHCPDSPWVFSYADGTPWRDIRGAFARACRDAGIENFRPHDLRHTCASWLVMAGTPLAEIRDLLGHSTVMMTERYAHLGPESLRATVARLDALGADVTIASRSPDAARLKSS